MRGVFRFRTASLAALVLVFAVGSARAEPLYDLLARMLEEHDRIQAAEADLEQARLGVKQAIAGWLPTLDLTANQGYEEQNKPNLSDTATGFYEIDIRAEQLIYDFDKTTSQIRSARVAVDQAEAALENTRQSLLVEGTDAYLNLLRAIETLNFARQSEDSIRRQTGMEEARVQRGSGFSTDVLQAKSQLAGARATRVRAEGSLVNAINRFRAVFEREVGDLTTYRRPRLPLDQLPRTVDDAVKIAEDSNLDLIIARLTIDAARHGVVSARADFLFPTLKASAEQLNKNNVSGTLDFKKETIFKVELTYPLFSGGADRAAYRSSFEAVSAANSRLLDTRRSVIERTRNAWQDLATARANAEFLRNQANIAGEFLDLARKERQLGTRSLLDVLNGEVNFINSISAAVSAETDMAVAVYNLMAAMGILKLEVFKEAAEEGTPMRQPQSLEGTPSAPQSPPAAAPQG